MKITREIVGLIDEWFDYEDSLTKDTLSKGLHCPVLVNYLGNRSEYCRACHRAFHIVSGCPCKMLGVNPVKRRAREILKLEEV